MILLWPSLISHRALIFDIYHHLVDVYHVCSNYVHVAKMTPSRGHVFYIVVRALRDKNRSRAKCVPIYGDLYKNLQWSLTFNLKVVTHLKSASEASYDVINMATINRNGSLMKAIVCIGIVVLNKPKFFFHTISYILVTLWLSQGIL